MGVGLHNQTNQSQNPSRTQDPTKAHPGGAWWPKNAGIWGQPTHPSLCPSTPLGVGGGPLSNSLAMCTLDRGQQKRRLEAAVASWFVCGRAVGHFGITASYCTV